MTDEAASKQMLSIPNQEKLEYSTGIDGAQIWVDGFGRGINKVKGCQAKTELLAVINTGKHAEVNWVDSASVSAENPQLNEDQITAVVKARNKECADELIHVKECRIAVNALLHSVMGKSSLEVLKADPIYEDNDKNSMDPAVTWARIMATHVLEREGPGVQKQIISVNNLLHQFTAMRQNAAVESITEHYQRRDRAKKALSTSGFDIDKLWLDTEEKRVVHFLHSLDPSRYGGLIRDVSNGVVAIPGSMTDLLTMARDRKEIAYGSNKRERTLLTDNDSLQDPLQPYEWLSHEEWVALSAEKKENMSEHNNRIEKAGDSLAKMGWCDGRWKRRNKPPDTPVQRYLSAVKEKRKKWESNTK